MKRLLFALLLCGCQQRTELMVGLITDISAPAPLDIAHLQVFPDGDTTKTPKIDTFWMLEPGFDRLPGSFGLNSGDGSSPTVEILVTGERPTGTGDNVVFLKRRARVTLVGGKVLFMRMALVGACMDRTDCTDAQTCREGVCVDKQVDNQILPEFDQTGAQVGSVECGSAIFHDTNGGMSIVGDGAKEPPGTPECNGGPCIEGTCYKATQVNGIPNAQDGGTTGDCAAATAQCSACVAAGGTSCQNICTQMGCPANCCGSGTGGGKDMGVQAQSLQIQPVNPVVSVSGTLQLHCILMPDGIDVTNTVHWFTSNAAVAMIQSTASPMPGMVTGVSQGVTTIMAQYQQLALNTQTTLSVQ